MNIKTLYYSLICYTCFLLMLWGAVEITSGTIHAVFPSPKYDVNVQAEARAIDPGVDDFYQKKTAYDGITEGVAKLLIPGMIFAYSRRKL